MEIHKFISSYNRAGHRIEELIEKVKTESHLKEKAHYEMLMSQISPHFIFNTVNSIRIMAKRNRMRGHPARWNPWGKYCTVCMTTGTA